MPCHAMPAEGPPAGGPGGGEGMVEGGGGGKVGWGSKWEWAHTKVLDKAPT